MRRDHTSTPPKPESEMKAKATNRSSRAGVGGDGASGGGGEAAESVSGMVAKVKARLAPRTKRFVGTGPQARGAPPAPRLALPALFSPARKAYIEWCRREPAMAINGRRNKPIGPGGGTRRLHHQGVSDQEPQSERLPIADY